MTLRSLFSRFKRGSSDAEAATVLDDAPNPDSSYFSTQFLERPDEAQSLATWEARALELQARAMPRVEAEPLFLRLWNADRFVAALPATDLGRLAGYMQFVQVGPNREVIGQDEQGDYMLIVLEGTVAVDRVQPWGGRARLGEARAGDMLGEMSLLDTGARFCACTTLTDCTLAVIQAQALDEMIQEDPRLALAVLASLSRRLSLRLRQVSARLSAVLSSS